jgi:adenine deaminase
MPISKDDFAKGRTEDALIVKIQRFLDSNMRHIYPEHIAWPGDTIAFNSAMLILAYAGKIELRYIKTSVGVKTYFMTK